MHAARMHAHTHTRMHKHSDTDKHAWGSGSGEIGELGKRDGRAETAGRGGEGGNDGVGHTKREQTQPSEYSGRGGRRDWERGEREGTAAHMTGVYPFRPVNTTSISLLQRSAKTGAWDDGQCRTSGGQPPRAEWVRSTSRSKAP